MRPIFVIGSESDPMTCKLVIDESFTGEVKGNIFVSNMAYRNGTTVYSNSVAEVNGNGTISAIYGLNPSADSKWYGDTTMTINGSKMLTAIYGRGANPVLDGEINVTINSTVERVIRAYASSNGADVADSAITYATNTIRVEDIKGWETKTPVGDPALEPDVYMPTVFVSANGTGDGSAPDKPLGNTAGYNPMDVTSYQQNALYKAVANLSAMGGRIVLVGPVAIDTAESRLTGTGQSPSEFNFPEAGGEIIITSTYNGVDYAKTNGAKLVLDQDQCSVAFVVFKAPVTFDRLTIEHKYNASDTNGWGTPMVLCANGNKMVVESTVTVTAWDAAKNAEGNWYPAILGGHRYYTKNIVNTDVTIKAGNWSFVGANCYGMSDAYPGAITGNATLNIEGGRIEAVYGTSSHNKPYGSIGGKLEINVTGGFVEALYATAKNGAKNEIVVNIAGTADRVAKAWGGTSDTNIPANATINYDRTVTRDDEVKYWAVVNAVGDADKQPAPYYYTLYVANVERGKGDGSSPENAIGHAAGYYQERQKAIALLKTVNQTYADLSKENQSYVSSVYKMNALYRALTYNGSKIVNQGGKIVVCDILTIDSTDAMRKSLADFWAPGGAETIIITSKDDTTDYRFKGAGLILDTTEVGLCVELGSPTVFDSILIEHRYNSKNGKSIDNGAIIAARGNKLTIGYDVQVIATDVNPDEDARIEMYPSLCGGHRYSNSKSDNYVVVGAGQWAAVVGGDWGATHTGNATISIDGSAKVGTVCGTHKPTASGSKLIFDGSVWIGLWGGEVDNVYVVAKPGLKWGDASIGLGGTKINGKVRATHPDYSGEEIQSWVFNYTNEQINKDKIVGFEEPVPATGSALPYLMVVASVSLVSAVAVIVFKKRKAARG